MATVQTQCWACGEPTPHTGEFDFGFEKCPNCGLVFKPAAAEGVADLYEGEEYFEGYFSEGYLTDAEQRFHEAEVRLDWMLTYVEPGRMFEIGAAAGVFLEAARRRGFEVSGVEPSPGMAKTARDEFGVDVTTGIIEDVDLPPASFDTITGWHVFEHVPQPQPALEQVRELLVPGGLLFAEVPNFASTMGQREREQWFHFQPEVHVAQFGAQSMRTLLERSGFEVVDVMSVSPLAYLRFGRAIDPRSIVARLKEAAAVPPWQRERRHSDLELLRVVARRPA